MLGRKSFSQIITKDRLSLVHLEERPGAPDARADRALLQSPRITLAIDALLRVYDHVLLDAGTASDLPAELLTAQARAWWCPDASMAADARTLMSDQLGAVGFGEVTMLSKPAQPSDAIEPRPAGGGGLSRLRPGFACRVSGETRFAVFAPCEKAPDCASPAAWCG